MDSVSEAQPDLYVGRDNFSQSLIRLLGGNRKKNLSIQSIEGPGGIGKSALLEHVMRSADLSQRKYLILKINGNDESTRNIFSTINSMINNANYPIKLQIPSSSYFPSVAQVSACYDEIQIEAQKELSSKDIEIEPHALSRVLDVAFSLGGALNEISPKTKDYLDAAKLGKHKTNFDLFFREANVFVREAPSILEQLGVGTNTSLRNEIRTNALIPLANAFFKDLNTIFNGYERSGIFQPSQPKLKDVDNLLLIIDDYETTKQALEEFLISHLLEKLKTADFNTVVLILGRDDIKNTHPGWDQHFDYNLEKSIKLLPFSESELNKLLIMNNVIETTEIDRAWRETQGYPFLVQLWLEEFENGGRSAPLLKRFYERTTRWMNEEQKKWLSYAIFMAEVNRNTFQAALGDLNEGDRAWQWFENEGSVRDTRGLPYRVNEYIRSRIDDYLKITDPENYERCKDASVRVV